MNAEKIITGMHSQMSLHHFQALSQTHQGLESQSYQTDTEFSQFQVALKETSQKI